MVLENYKKKLSKHLKSAREEMESTKFKDAFTIRNCENVTKRFIPPFFLIRSGMSLEILLTIK